MDYPKSVPGVGLVNGRFVNEDAATEQVGSIIPAEWGNALMSELFAVFDEAGLEPNEADNTQLLQALNLLYVEKGSTLPVLATAPTVNVGPIIYALDRQQALLWQTIGTFTGYASAEVGDFRWGTSISPKPGTELLIGQTIDRTLPKYAALIAWAEVNGHMTASASWEKGAFHFSDMGANLIRLPDLRDQFIRATGTDADTANATVLGGHKLDTIKSHDITLSNGGYAVWTSLGDNVSIQFPNAGVAVGTANLSYVGGAETAPVHTYLHPVIAL